MEEQLSLNHCNDKGMLTLNNETIPNHTSESHCIKELMDNVDIIIKEADKGGKLVIMDKTLYIEECYNHLNNIEYYKRTNDPIWLRNKSNIKVILKKLLDGRWISQKQFLFLSPPTIVRPRIFYMLPKIHKPTHDWPNQNMPPGRPIISDIDSESYNISKYIDFFLKPISNKHNSYIKDSYDFLTKIQKQPIEKDSLLVTFDVASLYTNMNLNRTIAVVKQYFKKYPDPTRPTEHIINLLKICIKNNDFTFNTDTFIQTKGIAMGKSFAPNLANLYLLDFDDKLSRGFNQTIPKLYYRFLDDGFLIWNNSIQELLLFQNYLNNITEGITIKFEYNQQYINYLDLTIYKTQIHNNFILSSRTYFKPTNTLSLLHRSSFHPKHTFEGIIKSQYNRFYKHSSTYEDYNYTCKTFMESLMNRGYDLKLLRAMKIKTWSGDIQREGSNNRYPQITENNQLEHRNTDARDATISSTIPSNSTEILANKPNNKNRNRMEVLPIVLPFNNISMRIAKEWKQALKNNPYFNIYSPLAAFKNSPNIGKQLIRAELNKTSLDSKPQGTSNYQLGSTPSLQPLNEYTSNKNEPGFNLCKSTNCITCKNHASTSLSFKSEKYKCTYPILNKVGCLTFNLIYLITCNKCHTQYVGETGRTLTNRLTEHRLNIKNKNNTPIGIHFNTINHSIQDLRITIIEHMPDGTIPLRRTREKYWQIQLGTIHPLGLNNMPT